MKEGQVRPRKRILLIDTNEDRRGELAFVLETKGYSVKAIPRGEINVIVAHWPIAYGIAKKLKEQNPDAPLIVLAPCAESFPHCPYADIMLWNNVSRAEFLLQVGISAARKRGPKKVREEVAAA